MRVFKWGNSLAVRLPAQVVDMLGLREGDDIELAVAGTRRVSVKSAAEDAEVLARLRSYRGRLPPGFGFDRLEANERR